MRNFAEDRGDWALRTSRSEFCLCVSCNWLLHD